MELNQSNIVDTIDLEPRHLEEIKKVLARSLPYKKVLAYGSRVKWTATERSDLDLVVFDAKDSEIENAKEALNESNVPFIIQLMNWQNIPNDFKKNIEEKYFIFQTEDDWAEFRLGDVADVVNGYAFKSINFTDEKIDGSLPVIKIKNVANGDVEISDVQYHKYTDELKKFVVKKGDILITLTGNHPHAITQVVGQASLYKLQEDALLNQRVAKIVSKPILDSAYLYNFLMSDDVHNYLASQSSGSANQANISKSDIENISIILPPLEEQKAIAEVLSSLDDKIDLLHRQNQTLEKLAESHFRHLFIDNAQDDWEKGKLGDFLTPKKGKNITKSQVVDGLVPVIAGGLSPSCFHNEANTSAPVITISASGANAGYVALHHKQVWSSDSSFIDKSITPYVYFFYVFLKSNQEKITDKQEGSAQPHIYPSHLMDLDILKYPDDMILECENFLDKIFSKIGANVEQIHNLEKTRDQLLPKLMSGEMKLIF